MIKEKWVIEKTKYGTYDVIAMRKNENGEWKRNDFRTLSFHSESSAIDACDYLNLRILKEEK